MCAPFDLEAPPAPRVRSSASALPDSASATAARALAPARGADSNAVASFPFALSVYLFLMIGFVALGWGAILGSVLLAITGFLIALLGAALYGRGH